MQKTLCLTLLLGLLLTGCGLKPTSEAVPTAGPTTPVLPTSAVPETAAPTAEPSTVPLPDPEDDPKGYLLACLDWAMEGEEVFIRFWQHPGSEPSPVELSVADYGQELRELFSALEWEKVDQPNYESDEEIANAPFNQPGAYSVSIYYGDPWDGYIHCGTKDAVVMIGNNGPDSVYLRADGAEELCDKLADLTPSLYINMGRTRVPPQESPETTLKLYVETALERLKENGHITDYELRAYRIISPEELGSQPAEEEYPTIHYTIDYAIKPVRPERFPEAKDGWVEVSWGEDGWDIIAYDERDGCYGMY